MAAAELKSDFKLTKDTSYLALTGKLCDVSFVRIWGYWLRYNGTALYYIFSEFMWSYTLHFTTASLALGSVK